MQLEENLDPKDWQAMRAMAHLMIDDAMDYLQDVGNRPVWEATPQTTKALTQQTLPQEGSPVEEIYQDFKQHIMPYTKGNIHPRFFAWVQGTGTPLGVLADMWAATMNPNAAIGDHAAMYVDKQVVNWCKEMMGFPTEASGILLSGGSIANITAITVARNAFDTKIRAEGLAAMPGALTMYGSTETHSCLQKAAEVNGIGTAGFRKIDVDANYQINLDKLEQTILADKAAGKIPFCIVGNVGTVNTAATDNLDALADLAQKYQLWFHIDGAFGALAKLVPAYQAELKAIERADSIAFDLHKWMYMPYEVGCALIKDAQAHRNAYGLQPSYLISHERGLAAGPDPITNYGMELSRGFKALKVWMSIREHGIQKYARMIEQKYTASFLFGRVDKPRTIVRIDGSRYDEYRLF
jgi:aromatic-L-amino-acid/L-tryptophan decarboxylase